MLKVNTVTRFFVIAIALLASSCSQQATIKTVSGCYDPTILPAFKAWGFLDDKLVIPSKTELDDIRERVGINKIELDSPTSLRKLNPKSHLDFESPLIR
ncbi:MAG: FAD:protein FMN transferase [Pseudomonadota bacterium]